MKYGLFESTLQECDHEIILEEIPDRFVVQIWCEDCLYKHSFELVESFNSLDELWTFLKEEV